MTQPGPIRSFLVPGLIVLVILVSIGIMAYVQIAVKRIESELPLRVMQERRDMEQVARNFYEFLATTEAALARSSPAALSSVSNSLLAVERDLEKLRGRYTFDTLIGASALHAVLAPVADDVRIWLTEGFGNVPASSPLVLEVIATRTRDALSKVYDKTTEADRIAYEILERQSKEMHQLRGRVFLGLGGFAVLAVSFAWIAVHQQRAARGQRAAEAARLHAQTRLSDALESTSEGFAFFEPTERLAIYNARYRDLWLEDLDDDPDPASLPTFTEVTQAALRRELLDLPSSSEAWMEERLAQFRDPRGPVAFRLNDGRWIQADERKSSDGGTVAVYSDITELKQREEELMRAKEEAESASQAKSTFLANVSHELRTPLTSILGFSHIIRRRLAEVIFPAVAGEDPQVARAMSQVEGNLSIMLVEGERLTALVNNVLDLEKIEAGAMRWDVERLDVGEVLESAAAATRSLYEGKDVVFRLDIGSSLPPVRADRDRIMQVLVNLISNAVKFTEAGEIRCTAERTSEAFVTITVSDTGVGISSQDFEHVFEKFRQVGDTLTNKPSGTGLGLPICKEIVEHLGGTITVQSEVGCGSCFLFTLPTAARPGESAKARSN